MVRLTYQGLQKFFIVSALSVLIFAAGYTVSDWRAGRAAAPELVRRFTSAPTTDSVEAADFGKFWEVWKRLEKSYVDPTKLDYAQMTWGAMEGLAQSLGDPYTQYLPPKENKAANEDLKGSFYGVGIELGYRDETLAAIAPITNSPAERAGIKAGDFILHIKDEKKNVDLDTRGMSLPTAVSHIRGDKGTEVTLTIFRDGVDKSFEVKLTRDEIVVPSVELAYVEKGGKTYAHLELHRFGGRTDKEWNEKVAEIIAKRPDGVVLDLRNNPGGYLDGAVFVASEFLSEGVVVKQEGRMDSETYSVNRNGSLIKIPLVVLINKGSASASEIVAGALQDNKRAKIVGDKSFGKGTVQEVQDLTDGSSLHVTVAKWKTPSGKWIHEDGITPDVEVKDETAKEGEKEVDEQLQKALESF